MKKVINILIILFFISCKPVNIPKDYCEGDFETFPEQAVSKKQYDLVFHDVNNKGHTRLQPVSYAENIIGYKVTRITDNSALQMLGIETGDILCSINNLSFSSEYNIDIIADLMQNSDSLEFKVFRKNKLILIKNSLRN